MKENNKVARNKNRGQERAIKGQNRQRSSDQGQDKELAQIPQGQNCSKFRKGQKDKN